MGLFSKSKPKPAPAPTAKPVATPAPSAVDQGRAIIVDPALEAVIQKKGSQFLELSRGNKTGMLSTAFWSDKLMDWSMKDEAFKVQLFRFVDAFPTLKTSD